MWTNYNVHRCHLTIFSIAITVNRYDEYCTRTRGSNTIRLSYCGREFRVVLSRRISQFSLSSMSRLYRSLWFESEYSTRSKSRLDPCVRGGRLLFHIVDWSLVIINALRNRKGRKSRVSTRINVSFKWVQSDSSVLNRIQIVDRTEDVTESTVAEHTYRSYHIPVNDRRGVTRARAL